MHRWCGSSNVKKRWGFTIGGSTREEASWHNDVSGEDEGPQNYPGLLGPMDGDGNEGVARDLWRVWR